MSLEKKLLLLFTPDPELDNLFWCPYPNQYTDVYQLLNDEDWVEWAEGVQKLIYYEFYDRVGPGLSRLDLAGNWVFYIEDKYEYEYELLGAIKKEHEAEIHLRFVKRLYAKALGPVSHFIQTDIYGIPAEGLPRSAGTFHYSDPNRNAEFFKECLKIYFDANNTWIQAKDKCEVLIVDRFQHFWISAWEDEEKEVQSKLDKMAKEIRNLGHHW